MSVLSGGAIGIRSNQMGLITPFSYGGKFKGLSYGVSVAGYDIRLDQDIWIGPKGFKLGSSMELFTMPIDLIARVCDKSTWARQGITVQNTVIEPGWRGFLTLEICNHSWRPRKLFRGAPIAQVIFEQVFDPNPAGYQGKYQNQSSGPQPARFR